jgi:antitoxin YqcF
LAAAAFSTMRTGKVCHPSSVMPGYVREYFRSTTVPHLYFTAPFLWEASLRTLDCGTKKVAWLLAIPISDGELGYLERHGDEELEVLFEKKQIDVYDLNRSSVA